MSRVRGKARGMVPKGRRGQRLSRERIVAAAAAVLDSEGEQALSMRRLGGELGVEAMALYNHFENREAILDAVADRFFEDVPVAAQARAWRARLRGLASGFREAALRHPNRFRVAMSRPSKPARALPLMEMVLGALGEAGVAPGRRLHAYHTLAAYIRGFLAWEMDVRDGRCEMDVAPEHLEMFPNVRAAGLSSDPGEMERAFLAGVDVILDGATG